MLKRFSRYFLVFCAGLAIASIMPVVASPLKETAQETQISREMLLAQGSSEASLNKLAGCLDRSGFRYIGTNEPQATQSFPVQGGTSEPVPNSTDGRIDNARADCANLRNEGQIQQTIRCIPNGEVVQVQFKDGQPLTVEWDNGQYVFVISYTDKSKGWVLAESVNFDRSP